VRGSGFAYREGRTASLQVGKREKTFLTEKEIAGEGKKSSIYRAFGKDRTCPVREE